MLYVCNTSLKINESNSPTRIFIVPKDTHMLLLVKVTCENTGSWRPWGNSGLVGWGWKQRIYLLYKHLKYSPAHHFQEHLSKIKEKFNDYRQLDTQDCSWIKISNSLRKVLLCICEVGCIFKVLVMYIYTRDIWSSRSARKGS